MLPVIIGRGAMASNSHVSTSWAMDVLCLGKQHSLNFAWGHTEYVEIVKILKYHCIIKL